MSVKIIFHQIEIGFWDVFVQMMHKSAFLRYLVPRIYRLFYSKEIHKMLIIAMVLMILGLTAGFVMGALSQI
jgi:hypothetical protein